MSIKANLLRLTARTGKLVDTAGNIINEADTILREENRDVTQTSRDGKLFRAFWSGQIPVGEAYDFIITIPAGREIYGVSRTQSVRGTLDVTFLVGGTPGAILYTADGYNFDETLNSTSVCTLQRVDGVTGASQRTANFVDTGGSSRKVSAYQTGIGAEVKLNSVKFPVFRYENMGNTIARLDLDLVWQEIPV